MAWVIVAGVDRAYLHAIALDTAAAARAVMAEADAVVALGNSETVGAILDVIDEIECADRAKPTDVLLRLLTELEALSRMLTEEVNRRAPST